MIIQVLAGSSAQWGGAIHEFLSQKGRRCKEIAIVTNTMDR
ncbi:MAG: hypothetical protein ACLFMM_04405 [Methanohalobium sp.]